MENEGLKKVFLITKIIDGEEISREEISDISEAKIIALSNEIASFNIRQQTLKEQGLINKPQIKLLITN